MTLPVMKESFTNRIAIERQLFHNIPAYAAPASRGPVSRVL